MRDMIGYVVAAAIAALTATAVLGFVVGTPFLLRALALPDLVGALAPDVAIGARRLAGAVAGRSFTVVAPMVWVAATAFFLVVLPIGLALYRATDSAWRGETFWENGKAGFAAAIFAIGAITVFVAEEMIGGPFAYLKIEPALVAAAAAFGGFVFGLMQPRTFRDRGARGPIAADVGSIRKPGGGLARRV